MRKNSRFEKTRKALLFWTLFIGIGAVAGATGMLADPTGKAMGMDAMLPYFQVLPLAEYLYQDFVFPGIALLIVNGLTNLTAAGLLFARKRSGVILGGIFGVTLMLWICIQFYMFPLNFMSTSYFIFGALQAVTGYMAWVFEKQERFCVRESDYPNIGTNPQELVVYFSRMGYTKKLALEEANRSGAQVLEIRAKERTEGTPGFWWCGRFGMHRWAMPIEEISADLAGYDCVTICTPIWVFHLAAPTRAFCKAASGRIKRARYVLVHHQKTSYAEAAQEMDDLLHLKAERVTSVCCRRGKYLSEKKIRECTETQGNGI